MSIEQTLIQEDVRKIATSGDTPKRTYKLELYIHQGCYEVMKVVDLIHDYKYLDGYSCEIMTTIVVGLNDYSTILMVGSKPVTAKLYETIGTTTTIKEYFAFFDKNNNSQVEESFSKENSDRYNLLALRYFSVQLIDKNLFYLKDELVGGTHRNCTMLDVLNNAFGYCINRVKTMTNTTNLYLNIVDPDNTKVYSQIVIPQTLRLFELPRYLQEKYGVYSHDISYFFQDGIMYVYPPYKLNNFDNVEHKLIIYNVPINRSFGQERTWRNDGLTLYLVNSQGMKNVNQVENSEVLHGNAVIKPNGKSLLSSAKVIEGTSDMTLNRSENTIEYAVNTRDDDLYNITPSSEFTNNDYKYYSKIAAKYGVLYDIPWANSVNRLIVPGTPVKVIREYNGEYITEYGVVLSFLNYEKIQSGTIYDDNYVGNGLLRVFMIPTYLYNKMITSQLST